MASLLNSPAPIPNQASPIQNPIQQNQQIVDPTQFDPTLHYYTWENFPNDLKSALKSIKSEQDQESRLTRNRQIPTWRRNEAFFKGIQRGIYSEIAHDYVTIQDLAGTDEFKDVDYEDYERCINMVRAHGEAIIAALSANIPNTKFTPADADNPDDISTAKAAQVISELIQLHNDAPLRIIKALYHIYCHGIAFSYNIYNRDKKFGIVRQPVIDTRTIVNYINTCPICSEPVDPSMPGMTIQCPNCLNEMVPVQSQTSETVPYIHSWDESPKGRSVIEVYGPLHVTVPFFVRNLDYCGYLKLDTDIDTALVKEIYPGFVFDKYPKNNYDRQARTPAEQPFYEGQNLSTVSRLWIRPWMFNRLHDDAQIKLLKEAFPNGAYTVWINDDDLAEVCDESVDDCWSVTESAISEYIHADPMANVLIPIQRMINDLVNLTMETIETGVSINFADPQVVNIPELANHHASPGDFVPAKARAGQTLESAFASTNPSTLGQGVETFNSYLTESAQFVLGSFPSIYGGPQGGSRTLGEYQKSNENALQRLSIPWKSIASWWSKTIKKAVVLFIDNMIEDEHFTKPLGGTSFINVWIKKADLGGKLGEVTIENAEELPVSWQQRRELFMQIFNQQPPNPALLQVVMHPENINMAWNMIGLSELYIPGDQDRDAQLKDIYTMISSGQPIPIEPMGDPHVRMEVIKAFIIGDVGQDLKVNNPQAYQAIQTQYQQYQQSIPPPPPQQKPPAESINFKDLPPDGQLQMAKQANIQLNPQQLIQQKMAENPQQISAPQGMTNA